MSWLSRLTTRSMSRVFGTRTATQDMIAAIDQCDDARRDWRKSLETAVDMGPEAVEEIRTALPACRGAKRSAAIWALAYIGGSGAISLLRHECERQHDSETRAALHLALASRGTTEDRECLVRAIEEGSMADRDLFDRTWYAVECAAWSLGVLRAKEALPTLERAMAGAPGIGIQVAAQWIRQGVFAVDATNVASVEAAILATVLETGVPRTDKASEFADPDRAGRWVRDVRRWSFHPGLEDAGAPKLGFRIHRSPDSLRALVSAGLVFGPANGAGYDYVLSKDPRWRVTGLVSTWIS